MKSCVLQSDMCDINAIFQREREAWAEYRAKYAEIWFADRYKTKEEVGAGLCGPKHQSSQGLCLERDNTVFQ